MSGLSAHTPRQRLLLLASVLLLSVTVASSAKGFYLLAKARLAQHLLERAWEDTQHLLQAVKPWPWADVRTFARLVVPGKADYIVLDNASGEALAFGPGRLAGRASAGTMIISGHRDTHMAFLQDAQPGDAIELTLMDGQVRHYRLSQFDIIDTRHESLRINEFTDDLILVTCYPFNALHPGGPQRLVVTATSENDNETAEAVPSVSISPITPL